MTALDAARTQARDARTQVALSVAQECGCECGMGHVCRPSWVPIELWTPQREMVHDQVESEIESAPGESLGQGLKLRGLTTRVHLEAPMDSTHNSASRHPNLGAR